MAKKTQRKLSPKSLLVVDDNYLSTLLQLLERAKKSVDIIAYSFAIGSAGGTLTRSGAPYKIAEALANQKTRLRSKIKIRLYLEGERETVDRNRNTAAFLKKAGVEVRYGATHAKGFCIDGQIVLFGSTNLTNQSITKNNETNLLIADEAAVDGFREYFEHLWNGGKHGEIELSPPMLADGAFKDALLELVARAKKTIEFSIYFFNQRQIEAALIKAHGRGVHVRGFIHNHNAFAMSYVRRTRATVERLKSAGIEDLHYGPTSLFTHSKYMIVDQKELLLGTGNWLDEDVEIHPQLYIQLKDAKVCKQLSAHLAAQIEEQS
ncbi:MAG: hypothetical protein EOP05_18625 [Proteobacteria bacterium]|nr:MAG: hypothetical protein EOP05_18625 [Pseudomonadota bacterium]